jgi:hypothetical protein
VSSAEHAQAFADALLGDHGEVLSGLSLSLSWFIPGKPGPRTRLVAAEPSALTSAVTSLAEQDTVLGVYVGVGLTKGHAAINPRTGRMFDRLAGPDVVGLAWLSADIDVAGGGHGDSRMPLAPNKATAIEVARCTGLAPTVLVDTGHGVQAHWRLYEPIIFGSVDVTDDGVPVIDPARVEADRKATERFVWEWVKSLQIRAKRDFGLHVDSTTDTARLMRCPGSYNRKVEGDHRPVLVLEVDPARRYDTDQIRAVLAPEKLLAASRFESTESTGSLAGADLPGLFAACRALPGYEPDWLTEVLASGWAPTLAEVWSGVKDAHYDNDDSAIDMALAATVLHAGLSAEMAAEAVMCRRLRIGRKIEKVDPTQRTSYLDMTISKCAAGLKEHEARTVAHQGSTAAGIAEMLATNQLPVEPDSAAQDPEPPTVVVDPASSSNDNAVSLEVEPPTPLRVVVEEPDPVTEHADAPVAPRQGLDGTIPAPLAPERHPAADEMAAMLGLPRGVSIWTVGVRRLSGHDEFRLWLRRTGDSVVLGGRWRPGTVAATRWHPKADWRARANVGELLLEDLHLVADVGREWSTGATGRRRMYELAVPMREGTPEEVAVMALTGLLREATGTGVFSRAVMSRDPWVHDGRVWVSMMAVRDWFRRLGARVPDMVDMVDLLVDMNCKVVSEMSHEEGNRVVSDSTQWVLVADALVSEQLAAELFYRASERDAADARSELREIP